MNEKTIDLSKSPPPLIPAVCDLWQAWWEDHDMWDGYNFYRAETDEDLECAQRHAAFDYVADEYCWHPSDEEKPPEIDLTWEFEHNRWHLLENGKGTGVTLFRVRIWEMRNRTGRGARSAPGTV